MELDLGEIPFILFYATTLCRLSFYQDDKFLDIYGKIYGNIIPLSLLKCINDADINDLLNDEKIYNLKSNNTDSQIKYFESNGRKYINFLGMEMPQKINELTDSVESRDYIKNLIFIKPETNRIKIISLATTNYSGIYIIADKKMPNCIWVIFRGTYSKKCKDNYTKAESFFPVKVNEDSDEKYMVGILRIIAEKIHTIIESMTHLARDFLKAKDAKSIKICTAGHSLGGALTTLFTYFMLNALRTDYYSTDIYNIFNDKIMCISLAAPRCLNTIVSRRFCYEVMNGNIIYKRITTRGDPVPAMPTKLQGFSHPCSDMLSVDLMLRHTVSLDCKDVLTKLTHYPTVVVKPRYDESINCINEKTKNIILYNPMSHILYLYIIFQNSKFLKEVGKAIKSLFIKEDTKPIEVMSLKEMSNSRSIKEFSVCRIIITTDDGSMSVFYKLDDSKFIKKGRPVNEDLRITNAVFKSLLSQMVSNTEDKSPTTVSADKIVKFDDTYNDICPEVLCIPNSRYNNIDKMESNKIYFVNYH